MMMKDYLNLLQVVVNSSELLHTIVDVRYDDSRSIR